ncbi:MULTISPECIES: amidohydrolase family protein [unclassified Mesorhizobium]|uniref:amidohydrolase family protein n=1 Tax=unclassified Mesorhizobium TaxID=325217 RepID=UPI000FDBAAB3|nr:MULTISPECIES: amidohydrolase family protein [unclassified Mesorhizobium]TGR44328.1 Enamidase [bacterium M00.F.Ca.ET.199.01.1.1]TGU33195.1 Enamidase [bacterium M00.F.Ca.ET.156.01.1.1]TGV87399.1 Enamidase [Mesorhizobium sp. M00.F.Ca.ET.149.01.1.1]TGR27483.1 Enamidase [Mesorhizobium sp. M8A.F.Ca.ET.202.01.1.1]TGR28500.1 Enamidase [Mesorhizobium sp. M8A.F.Ca.ET.197.01.1.1]
MSSDPKSSANTLVVRNIGLMLSGDLGRPILEADTIVVADGRISAIGKASEVDGGNAATIIDAMGCAVAPGLIDNHVHPVAGDWTPRQNQIGWMDSTVHGGVTTIISAGEVHTPGRPRDLVGLKALAIAAQRTFSNFRPNGMKILAGAPILEPGLVEEDFRALAEAGVTLVGEVGLGGVKDGPTGRQMIGWARKYGMTSMTHTGGPSLPGSGRIGADVVLEVDADIVAHVNGGPTALPEAEIRQICENGSRALEIVHNGNLRTGLFVLELARQRGELSRVILGTDSPAGSGVQPLGILRTLTTLASLGGIAPEVAFCLASGNTARVRGLADRGIIEVGRAADLIFIDQAIGGAGDGLLDSVALGNLPGIGMVIIDGEVRTNRSRNTPPAMRVPEVRAA